jgi:hypothetical protein
VSLDDVEKGLRGLLLGAQPALLPGVDEQRQQVYRRLVRNNLVGTLERACPHARRLAGAAFDDVAARWLATSPPTTRLLRDVPAQFTAWLAEQDPTTLPHGSFPELCHFEALEIEVTLSETASHDVAPLDDGAGLFLDPSARLAIYRHPVHTVTKATTTWPAPAPLPIVLLCFQRAELMAAQVLSPAVGKLLLLTSQGASLGAAIGSLVEEGGSAGVVVDTGRLRADLVDLQKRGALSRAR